MFLLLLTLQQVPAQNFPPVDKPGVVIHLDVLLDHACGPARVHGRNQLLATEVQLARPAVTGTLTADGWVALGCARARLYANGAIAHEGPLTVAGNSWSQGAQRAMLQALKQRPADANAAEVLSVLALDGDEPDDVAAALPVIRAAALQPTVTAATLRACDELALRRQDESTARVCAERGLSRGVDSTWHLLRLARLAFRASDTLRGLQLFDRATAAAHDSAARREIDWHLQWFLTPEEGTEWTTLVPAKYGDWVRDRLISRDVRDGQPFGARIAEHFGRLEHVDKWFRLNVPRMLHNSLRTMPASPDDAGRPTHDPDQELAAGRPEEPGAVPAMAWREYNRWQTDYDDRGIIWLRFGKPDQQIPWACPLTKSPCEKTHIVREAWQYNIDGQVLLLNFEGEGFDGSVQATRLVGGVLGSYLCDVDTERCRLTELSKQGTLQLADIQHIRVEDRESISEATTHDDNSVRGERNIAVVARLHRLWDPLNEQPVALVTWALPVKDLALEHQDPGYATAVSVEVRQWAPTTATWRDSTFTRQWTLPDTGGHRPALTGFVALPTATGVSAWSVVVSQTSQRRGRSFDTDTPGLSDGPVGISDLVLGSKAQGLTWTWHNTPIPLAPTGAVDPRAPVSLYYQIRSDQEQSGLRTSVAMYRASGATSDSLPALQVQYDQALHRGINEIAPELDVSRLAKGAYRLEVRLMNASGGVVARRSAPLNIE
jgi:hypothetical protein